MYENNAVNLEEDNARYIIQIAVAERDKLFCLDNEGRAWFLESALDGRKWKKLPELPQN